MAVVTLFSFKVHTMNNTELLKLRILSVVTRVMIRNEISITELAKSLRIAKHRIESFLNPSDPVLDLRVLVAVASELKIRLRVTTGKRKEPKSDSLRSANHNADLPQDVPMSSATFLTHRVQHH